MASVGKAALGAAVALTCLTRRLPAVTAMPAVTVTPQGATPQFRAARARLLLLITLILGFKLWLAAVFPYTGDEAYFIHWGAEPDLGFYDHPPMIGWLLALLLQVRARMGAAPAGGAASRLRWPSGSMRRLSGATDRKRRCSPRLRFLLLRRSTSGTFSSPPTRRSFCSLLRTRLLAGGNGRSPGLHALAGALLGLAFLSKYFAVLLGLVYVAYVLRSPRGERDWRGLALTCCARCRSPAVNAWWNYEHCWANLMFNLYNRHGDRRLRGRRRCSMARRFCMCSRRLRRRSSRAAAIGRPGRGAMLRRDSSSSPARCRSGCSRGFRR